MIVYLVGANVYYQVKHNNIYSNYKDKVDELKNISLTLENEGNMSQTDRLKQVSYQLRLKEEREENLTSQDKIKEEKVEAKKSNIEYLEEQLHSKFTELEQIKEEAGQVQSKLIKIKTYNVIFIFAAFTFLSINFIIRIAENRKPI